MSKGGDIPGQKTLAYLREKYPDAASEKVEYWNHYARRRHDLFGFADYICVGPEPGFILVQVTTRKQLSARRLKMLGKPQPSDKKPQEYAEYRVRSLYAWLAAGGRVLLHGWDQPGGKGTTWRRTEWEVTLEEAEYALRYGVPPRKGAV